MLKLVNLLVLLAFNILAQEYQINDELVPNGVRFLNMANKSIFLLGQNETIDIQGNLTINDYSVEDLLNSNITINGTFEVDFEDRPQIDIVVVDEKFIQDIINSTNASLFECIQNIDCNNGQFGPNQCLKIKNFKNINFNNTLEVESLLRNIEFITKKDKFSLFKYNQLLNQSSEFITQLTIKYNISYENLLNGGVCICDEKYSGYRCQNLLVKDKPNLCHFNSLFQSCDSGVCKTTNFNLKNQYKSYKCECDQDRIGLNCEYRSNKCSSKLNTSYMFQINEKSICPNSSQFCYPLTNENFNCINKNTKLNYLIFDDSNRNDTKLDVSKPEVLTQIQDFIKNYALPSYLSNDYSKIPKGPLGVLMQPIETLLSPIKNKFNQLIYQNRSNYLIDSQLDNLINNRVKILIQEIEKNDTNIEYIKSKLQLFDKKNFTDLQPIQSNMELFSTLNLTLSQLDSNLNKLNSSDLLVYKIDSQFYLNITNVTYSVIRLDILAGIYINSNEQLTIRPTPGLFLTSNTNDSNLIFLPGIFSSYSSECLNLDCIFMPGIMSIPIDTYDIGTYIDMSTKYLNKFSSLVLPFNINGILVPFKSLNITYLNTTNITANSQLMLTPLDFNQNSNFDFFKKNLSFITDIFSLDSFTKLIQSIDQTNSLLTQIQTSNQVKTNLKVDSEITNLNPKGVQFYNLITPNSNIKALPYLVYETNELNTISSEIIQKSIETYCNNYKYEMNELHSRLCEAQKRTTSLSNEFKNDCADKSDCSFSDFILDYYYNSENRSNSGNSLIIRKNIDSSNFIAILVLAAVLTFFWLLLLLFLCCCFLSFCPLAQWWKRRKRLVISSKNNDIIQTKKNSLRIENDGLNQSISSKIYSSNNNDVYYSASTASLYNFKETVPTSSLPPPFSTVINQQSQENKNKEEIIETKNSSIVNESPFYLKRLSHQIVTPRSSNASSETAKNFFSYVPSTTANYFYLKSEQPVNFYYINSSNPEEKIEDTGNAQTKIKNIISTISSSLTKNDLVPVKTNETNPQINNTIKCCSCNKKMNDLFQHEFECNDDEIFICDLCDYSWNSGSFLYNGSEFITGDDKDIIKISV